MTSIFYRTLPCLSIIIVFLSGFGSSLKMTTDSKSFNDMTKGEITVTCRGEDIGDTDIRIVLIKILKHGSRDPIVSIEEPQKITMGDNMKAVGHLDSVGSKSYLTLTINNPSIYDAGKYSCETWIFQKTTNILDVIQGDTGSIDFYKHDIPTVLALLIERHFALENTAKQQGDIISKQGDKIQEQERQLNILKNDKGQREELILLKDEIQRQNDTIRRQDEHIYSLERFHSSLKTKIEGQAAELILVKDNMKKQRTTISRQDEKLREQGDVMNKQDKENEQRVSTLKETLTKQGSIVQNQVNELMIYMEELQQDGETHQPAFSMGFTLEDKKFDAIFRFSDPLTNIGDAYNATSGVFTAPIDGLYVFHLVVMTDGDSYDEIGIQLKVNGIQKAKLYSEDRPLPATLSFLVPLKAQDRVWPRIGDTFQSSVMPGFSFFSGYLLNKM